MGAEIINGELILVILILVGIIGQAKVVAIAASFLLMVKLMKLQRFLPTLERRGMELGLLFLMIAILVPLVESHIATSDLVSPFVTVTGICTILGGIFATSLNGPGLSVLHKQPQLMVGIMVGSIVGIVFLHGVPVGPLTAAAIMFLLLTVYNWVRKITGI